MNGNVQLGNNPEFRVNVGELPANESERVAALEQSGLLDSPPEHVFESLVQLAQAICDVPIALVSLVDRERQWFKARVGIDLPETPRALAFSAHAILSPDALTTIENALEDARFCNNPLVLGPPYIRFYAGAPIVDAQGHALGTVCVLDRRKRTLSPEQKTALLALGRQAALMIGLRALSVRNTLRLQALSRRVSDAYGDLGNSGASLLRYQRVETIGELTSGIAHDFNNLLQALGTTFQILQRKAADTSQVISWASKGLESVHRGANLIENLHAMSKGRQPTELPLEIGPQIHGHAEILERILTSDAIQLDLDLGESTVVVCDPTQLEAAVLNLVMNARDAISGEGRISVKTRLYTAEKHLSLSDGEYVLIEVNDNGCGIPESDLNEIFDPFFTTKGDKGTGLGLAQVQGFAQRTNGWAGVVSTVGRGTTVSVYLRTMTQRDQRPHATAPQESPLPCNAPLNVLLVAEDSANRDALATLLIDTGYRVTSTSSGFAAIAAVEQHTPDIVLSDWNMPRLGGQKLARVLREVLVDVPILFSVGAEVELDSIARRSGIAFIRKPTTGDALIREISALTANRRTGVG